MEYSSNLGQSLTIEHIPSATVEPLIVAKLTDTLQDVVTKMKLNNFSQIPILKKDHAEGVVTWESIGKALTDNADAKLGDCIEREFPKRKLTDDLLKAIPDINDYGFVLVLKANNSVSGIVTSSDLGDELAKIARPLVLFAQLELVLRTLFESLKQKSLISSEQVSELLPASIKSSERVSEEMTLGELVTIVSHENVWGSFVTSYSQRAMAKSLNDAVHLRNQVMHFRELDVNNKQSLSQLQQLVTLMSSITVREN